MNIEYFTQKKFIANANAVSEIWLFLSGQNIMPTL